MRWAVPLIFGPVPPVGMIMTAATYIVVRDLLEGHFTHATHTCVLKATCNSATGPCNDPMGNRELPHPVAPGVQGSAVSKDGASIASLTFVQRIRLLLLIQSDYFGLAFTTLVSYGLIPGIMASW